MEWLTGIWQKMSKPLHYLAVGGAIIYFAPEDYKWTGYPLMAFGAAGTLEWFAVKAKYLWLMCLLNQKDENIEKRIKSLPAEEYKVFYKLKNEQTISIKARDKVGPGAKDVEEALEYGFLRILENKGLAKCSILKNYGGKFYIFGIPQNILEVFEKIIQKNAGIRIDE